ncbi:MAG: carbonic anhydrase family protein [Rubrivivax sp.]|nr:carbonic anhydrase family protein [Rubrivivax sp.]
MVPPATGYYAYEGSETAPPCTEGVRWLVMKQALSVSAAQLAALARLFQPWATGAATEQARGARASSGAASSV